MVKVAKMKKNQALEGKFVALGWLDCLRERWEVDSLAIWSLSLRQNRLFRRMVVGGCIYHGLIWGLVPGGWHYHWGQIGLSDSNIE